MCVEADQTAGRMPFFQDGQGTYHIRLPTVNKLSLLQHVQIVAEIHKASSCSLRVDGSVPSGKGV